MHWENKEIIFSPNFQKNFKKLDASNQHLIKKKLREIFAEDLTHQVKKLRNYPIAGYRLRIGNFRLLFNENESTIVFVGCFHRQDLY